LRGRWQGESTASLIRRGSISRRFSQGLQAAVSELFYADLIASPGPQIIVMENVDPPEHLIPSLNLIAFTANDSHGRYGLFPTEDEPLDGF
jgi:hypothetical protein